MSFHWELFFLKWLTLTDLLGKLILCIDMYEILCMSIDN
jgi:hypothetical protein